MTDPRKGNEFVYTGVVHPALKCGLCRGAVFQPHETDCEHYFCRICIDEHVSRMGSAPTCPTCESPLSNRNPHRKMTKMVWEIVGDLTVKCGKGSCDMIFSRKDYKSHQAACEWTTVSCPTGCGMEIARNAVTSHQKTCLAAQPVPPSEPEKPAFAFTGTQSKEHSTPKSRRRTKTGLTPRSGSYESMDTGDSNPTKTSPPVGGFRFDPQQQQQQQQQQQPQPPQQQQPPPQQSPQQEPDLSTLNNSSNSIKESLNPNEGCSNINGVFTFTGLNSAPRFGKPRKPKNPIPSKRIDSPTPSSSTGGVASPTWLNVNTGTAEQPAATKPVGGYHHSSSPRAKTVPYPEEDEPPPPPPPVDMNVDMNETVQVSVSLPQQQQPEQPPPPPPQRTQPTEQKPTPTEQPSNDNPPRKDSKSKGKKTSKRLKIGGDDAYESGNYEVAINLWSQAVDCNDGSTKLPVVYGNRSAARFMCQQYMECIEDCKVALEEDRGNAKLWSRMGKAACFMGKVDLALTLLKGGLQDPKLIKDSKDYNLVDSDYKTCVSISQALQRSETLLSNGKVNEAEAEISPFYNTHAEWPQIIFASVAVSVQKQQTEEALDILNKQIIAAQQRPGSLESELLAKAFLLKGKALYMKGFDKLKEALSVAEDGVCIAPDYQPLQDLAKKCRFLEDIKERGNERFRNKEWSKSSNIYTEGLELAADCPEMAKVLYTNRAAARKEMRQYKLAVADCTAALTLDPGYVLFIGVGKCLIFFYFEDVKYQTTTTALCVRTPEEEGVTWNLTTTRRRLRTLRMLNELDTLDKI